MFSYGKGMLAFSLIFFIVKEDNKNIRVFEITSLCASLGDGEACFLRQGAAHIRPHIFYC